MSTYQDAIRYHGFNKIHPPTEWWVWLYFIGFILLICFWVWYKSKPSKPYVRVETGTHKGSVCNDPNKDKWIALARQGGWKG